MTEKKPARQREEIMLEAFKKLRADEYESFVHFLHRSSQAMFTLLRAAVLAEPTGPIGRYQPEPTVEEVHEDEEGDSPLYADHEAGSVSAEA